MYFYNKQPIRIVIPHQCNISSLYLVWTELINSFRTSTLNFIRQIIGNVRFLWNVFSHLLGFIFQKFKQSSAGCCSCNRRLLWHIKKNKFIRAREEMCLDLPFAILKFLHNFSILEYQFAILTYLVKPAITSKNIWIPMLIPNIFKI